MGPHSAQKPVSSQSRARYDGGILLGGGAITEPSPKTQKKRLPYLKFLGPLLFLFFLTQVDLHALVQRLTGMGLWPLLTALVCIAGILILRTFRWRLFMKGDRLPYFEAMNIYALSALLGTLTPGQVGELSRVYYLRQRGFEPSISLYSALFDRLSDMCVLAVTAWLFYGYLHNAVLPAALALLAAAGATILFYKSGKGPAKRLFRRLAASHLEKIKRFSNKAGLEPPRYAPATIAAVMAHTLATWLLIWYAAWFMAVAMDIPLSFVYLSGTMAAASFLSLLPISVLGLGTRDAMFILLLGRIDIGAESALALSAGVLLLKLIYSFYCSLLLLTTGGQKTSAALRDSRAAQDPETENTAGT